MRLELQSEKGDTQVYYDGHTRVDIRRLFQHALSLHAAEEAGRWLEQRRAGSERRSPPQRLGTPSTHPANLTKPRASPRSKKRSPISKSTRTSPAPHPPTSPARPPTPCASPPRNPAACSPASSSPGMPVHGVPLRAAVYSTESSAPVLELAATSISYGSVEPSVFAFTPPANAKVEEVVLPKPGEHQGDSTQSGEHEHPTVTTHGSGPGTIAVLEAKAKSGSHPDAARRAAAGQGQRRHRQRADHRARHAAHLRALRRALPGRRLGHPRRRRSGRQGPLTHMTSSFLARTQGAWRAEHTSD